MGSGLRSTVYGFVRGRISSTPRRAAARSCSAFSTNCWTIGSANSGGMQNDSSPSRRVEYVPAPLLEPREFAGCDAGEVHRKSDAAESETHCCGAPRGRVLVFPDDDQVDVAVGTGVTAGPRAEQKDHRRRELGHDASSDFANSMIYVFGGHGVGSGLRSTVCVETRGSDQARRKSSWSISACRRIARSVPSGRSPG